MKAFIIRHVLHPINKNVLGRKLKQFVTTAKGESMDLCKFVHLIFINLGKHESFYTRVNFKAFNVSFVNSGIIMVFIVAHFSCLYQVVGLHIDTLQCHMFF